MSIPERKDIVERTSKDDGRELALLVFCVVARNGNLNAFFESSAHQKPTIFSAMQKSIDLKFNQSLHVERSITATNPS